MTMNDKSVEIMTKVVEILAPLSKEDRMRIIRASLVLLDDSGSSGKSLELESHLQEDFSSDSAGLPSRTRAWMKQNSITTDDLAEVFQITKDDATIIAAIPGGTVKEQVYNAYVLTGVSQLIISGTPFFQDKQARTQCESSGCYDSNNHSTYLNQKGNLFTGSKKTGWTLTVPGLKHAAEIIKEIKTHNNEQ